MLQIRIDAWLRKFMDDSEHRRRDDLHVDQIDAVFRDPSAWATAAVQCLRVAARVAEEQSWPITVAVELFLRPGSSHESLDVVDLDQLSDRWSHTPPALVVYRNGAEPWTKSESFERVGLTIDISVSDKLMIQSYFQQWYDESEGNYDRRLWLVGASRS